jgi:hypothetical protein
MPVTKPFVLVLGEVVQRSIGVADDGSLSSGEHAIPP